MEHQSLLCTNHVVGASIPDFPILTRGFPETGLGRPVSPVTLGGLVFPGTKEEPFWVT